MEDWMKQMTECNMQFQQNLIATIQDLKMQVGQLVDTRIATTRHPSAESETSRSRDRTES
ncbi:hypothetical protein CR513_45037, partial [Mucuna pruriens]